MRTLSALLMVLLLCSLQQMVYCGTGAIDSSKGCCQKLTKLQNVSLACIESYRWTSSNCPIKAVVFQTFKTFCVDPSWDWVKSHMKKLDKKKAAACRGRRQQGTEALGSSNDCCQKLTVLRKLPLARIESYRWTSSNCPIKAVVFQMVGLKSLCADPSWDWVKSHMKELD